MSEIRWNRFAPKGKKGKLKERPIRYASRADAYIFARYRHELSQLYEGKLHALNLSTNVLAYRRIPDALGHGNKCNIHFARDAFFEVINQGSCCTIALDISSFFESLDHARLKKEWCALLGVQALPPDHFKVFQNITNYAVADKEQVYERLGYYGPKTPKSGGKVKKGYLTAKKSMPLQLCNGSEFRQKIAGGDGRRSLIRKNRAVYGIPQGAPISDLLANLYLLEFDTEMRSIMQNCGGVYYRYSDDILLIAPIDASQAIYLEKLVRTKIGSFGKHLKIKSEKSSILRFWPREEQQEFEVVFDGQSPTQKVRAKWKELKATGASLSSPATRKHLKAAWDEGRRSLNGVEYLGFRFDGRNVYLRDSTLSNLWRKITSGVRRETRRFVAAHSSVGLAEIKKEFKSRHEAIVKSYGRVEDFKELGDEHRSWTFWTYAQRSAKIFGPLGNQILKQLRGHRSKILDRADWALNRAYAKSKSAA